MSMKFNPISFKNITTWICSNALIQIVIFNPVWLMFLHEIISKNIGQSFIPNEMLGFLSKDDELNPLKSFILWVVIIY